jgi:Ni/Co efflux regulator RcnB
MKTLIYGLLAAATLFPGAAMAQSRGELQRDREDIREERRELDRAYRSGDRDDIRDERDDVRDAREEYREDLRDRRDDRRDDRWSDRDNRGYNYAPVRAGHRLNARYYAPRYFVARPGDYRLPRANGPFRWVRYGNDFLLVNVRNGMVRDVVRSRSGWRR